MEPTPVQVFRQCVEAIQNGILISRVSATDKEFHFQNWFEVRLQALGLNYEIGGRNSYPDFRIVSITDGFELKGLAYPGRDASFDSNRQVPTGYHNGRNIYYVFGRYPKNPDGNEYPVIDLVVCHGDFLNADHDYVHKNKSIKGFGSYGDILIRDRKMYVVPTPFRLVQNVAHQQTLILPSDMSAPDMIEVGELRRREMKEIILGYSFNLVTNEIEPETAANPNAGNEHIFRAWRLKGSPMSPASMHQISTSIDIIEDPEQDE